MSYCCVLTFCILPGIPTWNGPVLKWHKHCKPLDVSQDLEQCKKVCSETSSCNAFNIDKSLGNCTLRSCPVPIGLPYSGVEEDNDVGYVFKGIYVTSMGLGNDN